MPTLRELTEEIRRKEAEIRESPDGSVRSSKFPKLQRVVQLRGVACSGMTDWDELSELAHQIPVDDLRSIESSLSPFDPINIQYTSGTTGNPKGATLSHRNLLMNGFYSGACQNLTHRDRVRLPVPLHHCFGCVLGSLCCSVHGAAMVFPSEGFSPRSTLSAIEAEQVTSIYGVPTVFIAQLECRDFPHRDVSTLRTGIMAGSECPVELMKRVIEDMGASEITIGYGQTEASPLITQTRPDDPIELRVGTVGRTIPGSKQKSWILKPQRSLEITNRENYVDEVTESWSFTATCRIKQRTRSTQMDGCIPAILASVCRMVTFESQDV